MGFKISNILDYDNFIALDIWAFKIKALLCKIEWSELKIISQATLRQSKKDMLDGEITDIWAVSKSIQKVISKACQNIDTIPNDIIVLFNTWDFIYDFTGVNYVRKWDREPITMKEIDKMIEDVEIRSIDKAKIKTENRLGLLDSEVKLITTSITWIYIDWKRISNPIWFTGKNVKFNLINIFSPISKFNTIKNIIRDLDKNLISIVPLPISLPKLIEESPYNFDSNVFIDIWYTKITIVLQSNSEIIWFNVLNFWYSLVEELLRNKTWLSYLDTEKILSHIDEEFDKYSDYLDDIFDFIFTSIDIAIKDIEKSFFTKNIFLSWAWISDKFKTRIKDFFEKNNLWKQITAIDKYAQDDFVWDCRNNNSLTWVLSLAKAGKELMNIKKDPLVRMLKYVIYRYE